MAPGLDNTQSRGGEELPFMHQSSEVVVLVLLPMQKEEGKATRVNSEGELNRESQNVFKHSHCDAVGYSRDVLL